MAQVKSIAVIGAGTMGSGIALTAATSGINVFTVDVSDDQLARAKAYHIKTLGRSVEKQRMTQDEADVAAGRISYVSDMAAANQAEWVDDGLDQIRLVGKIVVELRFPGLGCGKDIVESGPRDAALVHHRRRGVDDRSSGSPALGRSRQLLAHGSSAPRSML